MTEPILQLSADELACAMDGVELDSLAGRFTGGAAGGGDLRLTPWRGHILAARRPMAEPLLLEDRRTGARCVLPAPGLRACRAAALAGLAARTLLAPGEVTAAVLGGGPTIQLHLKVIGHGLRGVGRVTVCPPPDRDDTVIAPKVLDGLDLAGIRLAVAATEGDAVSGADLVVVAAPTSGRLETRALTLGAVLVNATNQDLPEELVDSVDRLLVDDAGLIERNLTRYVVRRHLEGQRRIDADLGQVLAGTRAGRTRADQILLVELLSANALDPWLAGLLRRAARDRGIGGELFE